MRARLPFALCLVASALTLAAHGCAAGTKDSSTGSVGGSGGAGGEITGASGVGGGGAPGTPAATTTAVTAGSTADVQAATTNASTGVGGAGVGGAGVGGTSGSLDSTTSRAATTTGTGQACNSTFGESNDTQADAYDVGGGVEMDCSDSSVQTLHAALSDGTDVDWYKYEGDDGDFCSPDAYGQVTSSNGTQLTLCIFLECVNGDDENVSCPGGSFPETSDIGDPGCCSTGAMDIDVDCSGSIDDSSYVYMSVEDRTQSPMCTAYDLTWHF